MLIANRSRERAEQLVAAMAADASVVDWADLQAGKVKADVLANSTSIGMAPQVSPCSLFMYGTILTGPGAALCGQRHELRCSRRHLSYSAMLVRLIRLAHIQTMAGRQDCPMLALTVHHALNLGEPVEQEAERRKMQKSIKVYPLTQ